MTKTILIGTTAINRSALHSDNFPSWYQFINSLDRQKYQLHWFINIDYVEKLHEPILETESNFRRMIPDIPITFMSPEKPSGNFLKACQRLGQSIEIHVQKHQLNPQDVIIFWLEDDWKRNPNNIPLTDLIENYLGGLTCINLSFIRQNYIHALAPGLFNYRLWEQLHLQAWKKQTQHIDPECCVGKYFQKKFGKPDSIISITLINEYKQPKENFFEHPMFKFRNSYYTYHQESDKNIFNEQYVNQEQLKKLIDNKMTFIRVTTSMCLDGVNYGRHFMKNYDIVKRRIQKEGVIDFYK